MENYFDIDFKKDELKKKAVKGAGATFISSMGSIVFHVIGTMILARLLSPNDFGLVTMVASASLLFLNFGLNGFTEAIIQADDIDHGLVSTLFWINLVLVFALTLLFTAMAPLISWFYKEPRLISITIGMSFSILFTGFTTIHLSLLKRKMHFNSIAIIEILASISSLALAICLASLDFGVWALVLRRVSEPLVIAICAWTFCRWIPGSPKWAHNIKPMLKFSLNTYVRFLVNYFTRNSDKILLGRFTTAQSLGFYDRAYYLFSMPAEQLTVPVASVALATLSRLKNNPEDFIRYYLKILSMIAFIGALISVVLTLIGKDLVIILLGVKWTKTGQIFTILGPGIGVILIYATHSWLHLSLGTPHRWILWSIFSFIISNGLLIVGLHFGIFGVAVALVTAAYILIVPGLWFAGKPVNLKINLIFQRLWRYFISAISSGLITWWILYISDTVSFNVIELNVFLRISITTILCIFWYLVLIIILFSGFSPITELLSFIKEMLPNISLKKPKI